MTTQEKYEKYNETVAPSDELIEMCAQRVVNRSYNYDGTHGGMFPLRDTDRDQRFINLFSQLQSYIMEMDL